MVADDKNGHPPEAATGHASLEEIRLKMRELTDQLVPPRLTDEQLLPAVQDLIATMPPRVCFAERIPLIAEWIGEASAVLVGAWSPARVADVAGDRTHRLLWFHNMNPKQSE